MMPDVNAGSCRWLLAVVVGVLSAAPLEAQAPVEIRILYQPSAVRVGVQTLHYQGGMIRGDADGVLRLDMSSADSVEVGVQCPPGRRIFTRWIQGVWIRLDQREAVAYGHLPEGVCHEPPEVVGAIEVAGHYTAGFESSDLAPCQPFGDLRATMYEGLEQRAWVHLDRWPDFPEPDSIWTFNGYRYATWFVRMRGELRGPGGYGHLGGWLYSFEPDSVLEVRAPAPGDCESAPRRR